MALTTTPIAFSGTANKGALQIKPADVYVGRLDPATHEITGSKYIGYTSQQLTLTITEEKQKYMQNGATVQTVQVTKEAMAKFRLDQWDPDTLAFALGLGDILVDAANGNKRVLVEASNIVPEDWYIIFRTETIDGKDVEFGIPRGNVSVDGDITFGGGNESPTFNGVAISIEALAADINGDGGVVSVLAYYDYAYTNVPVTGISGLPATLAIAVGEKVQIVPVIAPASASDTRVTWESSDPTKATVSSTGVITGLVAGPTNITVTTVDQSETDVCAVTVS